MARTDFDAWLQALVSTLTSTDRALAGEIEELQGQRSGPALRTRSLPVSVRNIVLRVGRPVLAIVGNEARLDFAVNGAQAALLGAATETIAPRPRLLPPRLSPAEIEAHRAFVATLGAEALWLRY